MAECPPQGPEVQEWVATEIMEWTFGKHDCWYFDGKHITTEWAFSISKANWRPDEDLNHSAMMEKKIEEMGRAKEYVEALKDVTMAGEVRVFQVGDELEVEDTGMNLLEHHTWRFVRATPYERVQAAWKVLQEENR